jgi:ATP-dependent Lon protease
MTPSSPAANSPCPVIAFVAFTHGGAGLSEKTDAMAKLAVIGESLKAHDVEFTVEVKETLHDRHIVLSNGWTVKIGRGFDIYQRPDDWLHIGASDMDLRPCMETSVDIFRSK